MRSFGRWLGACSQRRRTISLDCVQALAFRRVNRCRARSDARLRARPDSPFAHHASRKPACTQDCGATSCYPSRRSFARNEADRGVPGTPAKAGVPSPGSPVGPEREPYHSRRQPPALLATALAAIAPAHLAPAAARTTRDVPTVVLGLPHGPGCAWPGSRTVDPVKESGDLPVHRVKHLASTLPRWIEIANLT